MPTLADLDLPPGSVVLRMKDGSFVVWESGQPDADLLFIGDKEGNVYSRFDGQDRPGHVEFKNGETGDFTYEPNGNVVLRMSDGSRITWDGDGEDANLLEIVDIERNIYTRFDDKNRPEHVEFADGRSGDFDYLSNGHVTLTVKDALTDERTVIEWDRHGDGAKLLSITDSDGNVYTEFDDKDRPGHVEYADGRSGDFEYLANGHVTLTLNDGTVIEFDGNDHLLSITGPDGVIYSQFDQNNHPTHVDYPDGSSGDLFYN